MSFCVRLCSYRSDENTYRESISSTNLQMPFRSCIKLSNTETDGSPTG